MKNKFLKIILGLISVVLITGCDKLPFNNIDNNIKDTIKESKEPKVYNINFNERISGKLYINYGWGGLTIITDNQTGREYMYYDKTVVELKPKGE